MYNEAKFEVSVSIEDALRFAGISGDWNPLHTDAQYAAGSMYGRQVLHGAFSAGLISRLAGMYLPGTDCLLYGMKLKFVNPVLPPVNLVVQGKTVVSSSNVSRVQANVTDANTGVLYVEASYDFSSHRMAAPVQDKPADAITKENEEEVILVTGASGGLGQAVLRSLGTKGLPLKRNELSGRLDGAANQHLEAGNYKITAIIHCAWPQPDTRRFIDLDDPALSIEQQVAGPLQDIQFVSALLARKGVTNAPLILVGSTFAQPGRHYFKMPLYSIAKSTIPAIVDVLSLELASRSKRCIGLIFDVIDGGMNKGISEATRLSNADRSPWGELATPEEAAQQILWLLDNTSKLVNGAMITLSGGSIP